MPRRVPHITVTAVVSPAIVEELDRLAAANQLTRSTMIRQLLEASLTQRANERLDSSYDRLEKRLAKMEERFSSLIVKSIRAAAQGMYLASVGLKFGHLKQEDKYMQKHWDDARTFAGQFLEGSAKKKSNE
jgi:predicted transcriptional regulator